MQLYMVLGYLGSGKTTFVNNMLQNIEGKTAVIVNDFGEYDVDSLLVENKTSELKKIYDGSIFCSCKSEYFVQAMLEVIANSPDSIIVEASGLANPYTMLRELNLIEQKANVKLSTTVFCLVDLSSYERVLPVLHSLTLQTALSDVVVLNKADKVDDITANRVEKLVREISNAKVIKTVNSKLDKYTGYPVVNKPDCKLVEDLLLQKLTLKLSKCTNKVLDMVCKRLSEVSSRIKGVVNFDGKYYVYEYIDGASKIYETTNEGNFLVVLSCLKSPLHKAVKEIIKDYDFLEIQ